MLPHESGFCLSLDVFEPKLNDLPGEGPDDCDSGTLGALPFETTLSVTDSYCKFS